MDLSQIDLSFIFIVCGLCIVGGLFLVVLQFFLGFLDIFAGLFDVVFGIIGGGPEAWCGCIFLLAAIVMCGGLIVTILSISSTCGTPEAVNFCRLF